LSYIIVYYIFYIW